jgi:hypothetical protein
MTPPKDFLDEMLAERARNNPRFLDLVEQATARRRLAKRRAKATTVRTVRVTKPRAR